MTQPRKHHFLPQFLLREFSANRTSLWQIEKPSGRTFRSSIKDTAAIRDFHEIDSDSVDDRQAIEKKLAEIEGKIGVHFRAFLAEGFSNEAAFVEVIAFVVMLRMRVPAIKRYIDRCQSEFIRSTGKMLRRTGKIPRPPMDLEEMLDLDNIEIKVTNWSTLQFMFHLAEDTESIEILRNMRATLYLAPLGCEFVTCDQPVALFHPTIGPTDPIGVGLKSNQVEVSVPLSRNKLLLFEWKRGQHREQVASGDKLAEFNRRTIVMAERFVYSSNCSESLVARVLAEKDSYAGFVFKTKPHVKSFVQVHRFIPVQPQQHQRSKSRLES